MNGHALMFGALWIGTAPICFCEQHALKVVEFDYAEGPETLMNSAVDLSRQVFHGAGEPRRTSTTQRDPVLASPPQMSSGIMGGPNPRIEVRVTVYVFNSAHVLPGDLIRAEALAAGIFEKAGIKVTWVAGLTARGIDDSQVGEKWNPASLLLRIRRGWTVRGTGVNSDALGFCLSMEKNEAIVLADATQNSAAMWNVDPVLYLGLTMAHEMGHLLLQSATHSLAGIMKARWPPEDLRAAERGNLTFTSEESRSMRNGALRRIETPASLQDRR